MCKKTKCMIFHRQQKQIQHFNVCIDNTVIERVESFNYLGIMLSETLSWKSHIGMVGKKISKVTGMLYRLRKTFTENVLFTLYNFLIISYINYGLLLWGIDCHKLKILKKESTTFYDQQ